jgi:dolichol-phosphate mannosyltransferase
MRKQMAGDGHPKVSMVFPVYNEEGNLEVLYESVRQALFQADVSYEMVFVDDGSADGSLEIIKGLAKQDPCVRYISLSRNFGHQSGLFAGMSYSRGDAVITMDTDLQHPPPLILEMVRLWREGYEVVYTTKRNSQFSRLTGYQAQFAYWLLSKGSGLKLSFGQSDFRLLDRKVVTALLAIPEYRKFLRGMVDWLGFRQVGLEYYVPPRYSGQSKLSYRARVSFALDGILAFSTLPLRWMLGIGVIIAGAALLYALVATVLGILSLSGAGAQLPPGWATLAAAITFFGAVQLIAIGVLGEYIGRIYEQTKGRPVFIVRETSDSLVGK